MKFVFLGVILCLSAVVHSAQKADLVIVTKSERKLMLLQNGTMLREYRIALGGDPLGHKRQEGDQRTPEGRYVLDYKKPDSSFHKAIHISYPNAEDKNQALKRGVKPGGLIMIHGQKNGLGWLGGISQHFDWTNGCIAVGNSEMDEIWQMVDVGTPIQINP